MKKVLLAIFGGRSTEHEVSCKSVLNIVRNIDTEEFDVLLTGITKEGRWLLVDSLASIEDGSWRDSAQSANLLPDAALQSLYIRHPDGSGELRRIDVIFPALHGKNGEDGTIQGLFELSGIPYVGCGVLSSAVSMDKLYTKVVAEEALRKIGVRQAKYIAVTGREAEDPESCAARVEKAFQYPVFVKPSNAGSSCGVSKAHDRTELLAALQKAYEVDRKILVEECIRGRELECAVIRGGDAVIHASGIGEIRAAADFYDYDAKYNNPESETDIAPELEEHMRELIRTAAKAVFAAVDGYGLSRVDFFLTEEGPVFNEINTMPGFTAISMYPMLWEAKGMDKRTLIQRLIETAFERKAQEAGGGRG